MIPDGEPAQIAIGNGFLLDTQKGDAFQVDREIQAVYYLAGDYDALLQMEEGEFFCGRASDKRTRGLKQGMAETAVPCSI